VVNFQIFFTLEAPGNVQLLVELTVMFISLQCDIS